LFKKDGRRAQISSVGRKLLYEIKPWLKQISYLELNDSLLGQAEVHPVGVLHVESAFVKLRDWVVGI
jgi:hypothetical protein